MLLNEKSPDILTGIIIFDGQDCLWQYCCNLCSWHNLSCTTTKAPVEQIHLNKMGKILYCSPMEKHLRTSYMLAMAGYNIYLCMLAWRSNVICLLKKNQCKKESRGRFMWIREGLNFCMWTAKLYYAWHVFFWIFLGFVVLKD